MISEMLVGQNAQRFLDSYNINQSTFGKKSNQYENVKGSPYLNNEFIDGELYLKDKTAYKLPLRYNIYTNNIEYKKNDVIYDIANPTDIDRIKLDKSVFVYLPFIGKGGYFELLDSGKCCLVIQYIVDYQEPEPPKPYVDSKPAQFSRGNDRLYMVVNGTQTFEIKNFKDVYKALQDQSKRIEDFVKSEKIKNTKKDNLVKIVKYYNSF